MHLDNTHSEKERQDILEWFEKKPDAILSSVSILTTGFDSPSVQTIILNRATKSLTLYHQMIGRGSRVLPSKLDFNVIDLGNNARRFGLWESHINWAEIFKSPNSYIEGLYSDEEIEETRRGNTSPVPALLSRRAEVQLHKDMEKRLDEILGFREDRVLLPLLLSTLELNTLPRSLT